MFALTFDEDFAKSSGMRVGLYKMLIALLCAITVVLGMKIIGTMLITALIVLPPLSAMRDMPKLSFGRLRIRDHFRGLLHCGNNGFIRFLCSGGRKHRYGESACSRALCDLFKSFLQ